MEPTELEALELERTASVARYIYNWGLARCEEYYRQQGKGKPWAELSSELTQLKQTEFRTARRSARLGTTGLRRGNCAGRSGVCRAPSRAAAIARKPDGAWPKFMSARQTCARSFCTSCLIAWS
jgi:hypothetical protein